MSAFTLSPIPAELQWQNQPLDWNVAADHTLTISAGEKTDLFIDPAGTFKIDNTPAALFTPPDENFQLSAKVTVGFASMYDAGVLQVRESHDVWAKLCFEYSPQGQPTIVSVVTRGTSDDCNSTAIDGNTVYLRLSRSGKTFAFHYSLDGVYWSMVRYFSLGELQQARVGFSSQSPTGQKCTSVFTEMRYQSGALKDIRSGE